MLPSSPTFQSKARNMSFSNSWSLKFSSFVREIRGVLMGGVSCWRKHKNKKRWMSMSKCGIPNGQSSIHECVQNVDAAANSIIVLVNFYNIWSSFKIMWDKLFLIRARTVCLVIKCKFCCKKKNIYIYILFLSIFLHFAALRRCSSGGDVRQEETHQANIQRTSDLRSGENIRADKISGRAGESTAGLLSGHDWVPGQGEDNVT